jgi:hypothetical protein
MNCGPDLVFVLEGLNLYNQVKERFLILVKCKLVVTAPSISSIIRTTSPSKLYTTGDGKVYDSRKDEKNMFSEELAESNMNFASAAVVFPHHLGAASRKLLEKDEVIVFNTVTKDEPDTLLATLFNSETLEFLRNLKL